MGPGFCRVGVTLVSLGTLSLGQRRRRGRDGKGGAGLGRLCHVRAPPGRAPREAHVALVQLLDFSVIASFSLPPSMARHFFRASVAMSAD